MKRFLFITLLCSCTNSITEDSNLICSPRNGLFKIHFEQLMGNCDRIEDQTILINNSYNQTICDNDVGHITYSDNGCSNVYDNVRCINDSYVNGHQTIEGGEIVWNEVGDYGEAIERIEVYEAGVEIEEDIPNYICAGKFKLRYYKK